MSSDPNNSNPEQSQGQSAKKSGLKRMMMGSMMFLVIAAAGAGGFYYWQHRATVAAHASAKAAEEKLARKQTDTTGRSDEEDVKEIIELQPFIVNLADKNETRYLRMTVSLGVGEGSDGKADPIYTTRVRNAILAIITNKTSDQVLSVEGKASLRKEMLNAARGAVEKPDVHAIYITDFIVQM